MSDRKTIPMAHTYLSWVRIGASTVWTPSSARKSVREA
jgi:hypothetical protein